ncbi:hypothetical protein RRG08_048056 [Elysia crispata]|uniref:Uncharacterized protein n=1 Tax=Elysia crispata TaxID=231223 RepID=A0AAE0Z2Q0_9GAST|nr:hypothetical protein RRG08_048056 [Elysia crispata]
MDLFDQNTLKIVQDGSVGSEHMTIEQNRRWICWIRTHEHRARSKMDLFDQNTLKIVQDGSVGLEYINIVQDGSVG